MWFVLGAPLILQLTVPLGLLAWLALGRHRSRAAWLAAVLLSAIYIVLIRLVGLWLILPWYTPAIYALLFLVVTPFSWRRTRREPGWPNGWRESLGLGVRCIFAVAALGALAHALAGRRQPEQAIDVEFPLGAGGYLVVNGGRNSMSSAHVATLAGAARLRPWRGQSYGVDIVQLGGGGLRADGALPRDPAAYRIFGAPVSAPCAGLIVGAVDGVKDMPPPRMDRAHMAGNHVLLECGNSWILLAHLRRGSVVVGLGDSVELGAALGRVGNSGNSGEPHLHIHAQRPGTPSEPLSGEPLHLTFGGRYPVRNARFTAP